jgi:hypothetical protein
MRNPIPYPLRAVRISLSLNPFGFWLKPRFVHKKNLTACAKANGETIWWARWAWFQISYSRWV